MTVNLSRTCLLSGILTIAAGCGETLADRREISRHTKELGAVIKAEQESEAGKEAMAELVEILHGDWSFAGVQACNVLSDLGPLAAPAVSDLIRTANCGDPFVEQDAIGALASIGPAAAPALELLVGIVERATTLSHGGLRSLYAVEALGNLGEPALSTIPLLQRASKSDNDLLAKEASRSLEELQQLEIAK
jgi:hypothetical protein